MDGLILKLFKRQSQFEMCNNNNEILQTIQNTFDRFVMLCNQPNFIITLTIDLTLLSGKKNKILNRMSTGIYL